MESDTELEDFDLATFLEKDSSSDSECEANLIDIVERKKQPDNILVERFSKVVNLQIKNNLPKQTTSKVLKLINNSFPESAVQLPESRKTIDTFLHTDLSYDIYVHCDNCDEFVKDKTKCPQCGVFYGKCSKKNNFFVHIPLKKQILLMLHRHFDTIISYLDRQHKNGIIADIDDGILLKEIIQKNKHVRVLSCTLNTDGGRMFNSSTYSLWPVQIYLNFLPPSIRYKPENIIVSTLYYGKKKPDMTNLLYFVAVEFDKFVEELITVYKERDFFNFFPVLSLAVFDLQARKDIQAMKGPMGKYGCPVCYHPGNPVKNLSKKTTIRYLTSDYKCRSHIETVNLSQKMANGECNVDEKGSIFGVKGHSPLLLFDNIDVINSVATDYMHGILLGITKDLIEIWIGKRKIPTPPYADYKIKTVKARKLLEQRILKLKPHVTFSRKPRSIFEVSDFKATELMCYLWYYLRYSLIGILPTKVIKNFEKLAVSSYILCKTEMSISEIVQACRLLKEFVTEFEQIYGPGSITMNIHLLSHYESMILNCGPLWSYSMFGFETNIGHLKKLISGTTDVLLQIAKKYINLRQVLYERDNKSEEKKINFYQKTSIIIDENQAYCGVIRNTGMIPCDKELNIWRRAKVKGECYSSTTAIHTKSIDYFIKLNSNAIGKIVFFFGIEEEPKLLLELYEETFNNFHWSEVRKINNFQVFFVSDIKEKLLYFECQNIEIITKEPNTYCRLSKFHISNPFSPGSFGT